jgi:hypothetical protein
MNVAGVSAVIIHSDQFIMYTVTAMADGYRCMTVAIAVVVTVTIAVSVAIAVIVAVGIGVAVIVGWWLGASTGRSGDDIVLVMNVAGVSAVIIHSDLYIVLAVTAMADGYRCVTVAIAVVVTIMVFITVTILVFVGAGLAAVIIAIMAVVVLITAAPIVIAVIFAVIPDATAAGQAIGRGAGCEQHREDHGQSHKGEYDSSPVGLMMIHTVSLLLNLRTLKLSCPECQERIKV